MGHPSLRGRNSELGIWRPKFSLRAPPRCLPFLGLCPPLQQEMRPGQGMLSQLEEHVPSVREEVDSQHHLNWL